MKRILTILILFFVCFLTKGQSNGDPVGFPTLNSAPYYKYSGYLQVADGKAFINGTTDTNWHPRFAGTQIYKSSDSSIYWWTGNIWVKASSGSGGSQGFQDVLTVDPDLTGNNIVDGGAFAFEWLNNSAYRIQTSSGSESASIDFIGSGDANIYTSSSITLNAGDSIFNIPQPPQYSGNSTYSIGWEAGKLVSTNPGVVVTGNVYYAIDSTNTPPGGPATGDVYMVGGAGTGAWSGHNYDIATWNGASWDFTDPTTGDVAVVTSTKKTYKYNGSTWVITGGIPLLVGGNNLNTFLEFGALSNNGVAWITNGLRRISITNGGAISFNRGANAYTFPSTNSAGVLTNNGSGTLTWSAAAAGTVTSVGLTMPTGFSVANSPVTSSGTLAVTTTLNGILKGDGSGFGTVTIGSGLSYDGTTLTATATAPTWQQTLDATNGQIITTDHTITATGLSWVHNGGRFTWNASDSILLGAATKISFSSLDSLNGRASVNWFKSARAFWGASSLAYIGVDSIGFRIQNGLIYALGTTTGTGSIGRIDPTTKALGYSSTIALGSEVAGVLTEGFGGTNQTTYTTGDILYATGANTLGKRGIGSANQVLTVSGGVPTWATPSTSPFSRGVMSGVNSLNLIYQTTLTDSVVLGNLTSGTPLAKLHSVGTAYFSGIVGIGQSPATSSTYELQVSGDILATATLRTNGAAAIGTFADAAAGTQYLHVQHNNTSGGIGVKVGNGVSSTNGNQIGYQFTISANQTSAGAGVGHVGYQSSIGQGVGSTFVSNYMLGFENIMSLQSTSATDIPTGDGFRNTISRTGAGTQKYTVFSAFHDRGITGTSLMAATYYGVKLDSSLSTNGTTIYGIYQSKNTANSIKNVLEGPTSIGGTITNDAASAGSVGEEVVGIQSTYTNYTTTATYQNITSITLTAGDWDLSSFFTYSSNGSTITAASNAIFVISTTTASAAGAIEGRNIAYLPQAALLGTSLFSDAIPDYRVSISATTTYYLNTQATFTLGNPQYVGGLRARRMR